MNVEQARFNMIEQQIRPWGVMDAHLLDLLQRVKREDFCPPAYRNLAFADLQIPLPYGEMMLEPRVQARLVQDVQPHGQDKVLQIGAGSGYMTALLAHCAHHVLAFEIHPELADLARQNLRHAGIERVDLKTGDGFALAAQGGTFDAIVLCGSVSHVPHSLLEQLNVGGRLIAVVGDEPMMRATVVTRESDTVFQTTQPWDVVIPRLEGVSDTPAFTF